jgi:RNA polymerase sigma-70 factor, ECF subfamily
MPTPDPTEEFIFQLARYERMLAAYVIALVPHQQDADDILQEAKIVMWRSFSSFQRGTNFGAWARKIAFHRVLAFRKRCKRDRLEFSEEFLRAVSDEAERATDQWEQRERALQECIMKLPADHRDVLHLRYQRGLSLDAMAEQLQRTVTALYRQLSRVRQTLHECVERSLQRRENYEPGS